MSGTDAGGAGREMDAAVAERVMGWQWYDGLLCWYTPGCTLAEARSRREWTPSTDPAAAWQVVEKLGLSVVKSADGWYAIKPHDIEHGSVRGTDHPTLTLIGAEGETFACAETMPLAVCLCALAGGER